MANSNKQATSNKKNAVSSSRDRQVEKYSPNEIEVKWQQIWSKEKVYEPDMDHAKSPFFNLMMFPYPSAEGLHVGNMYAFTGADIIGRYYRMQGKDVLEPMGLDGFGIHSENYALKVDRTPQEHAGISEANFYRQLHMIGNGFSWSHKVETYDPNYYKWTQWLFIQLFKKGLAYRKKAPVNYCPKDKTVLADEQVIDGKCERCGTQVEKRNLEQWFFKITDYADRLLHNIEKLDWSEKVKIAQRNWIGKKEGIEITFHLANSEEKIAVFTTTPINFGATFLVIAPEHPLLEKITTPEQKKAVEAYIKQSKNKSDIERLAEGKDKTGVFTGSYVINHVTGEKIPVWVADYVLIGYGTGAVQGCPGHDERDFEFAKKFGIPIPRVVVGPHGETGPITDRAEQVHAGEKAGVMINSDFLNGIPFDEAMEKTKDYFEQKGWGKRVATFHLRDWLISRQRYWGPPIPMIYCEKCDWQPVPEDHLPILLPETEDWKPTGTGESPLAALTDWVTTSCPNCKGPARRETDVSDTFLDSSWYFFRYTSNTLADNAFNRERVEKWLPVHLYTGGAEHSVLHLLYSRFITMVLKDSGYISFEEPFAKFRAHGLIIKDGAKMSKSKGNVINPDEYIKKFGADTLRVYLMFLGPFSQGGDFRDSGIEGMERFLRRVWTLVNSAYSSQITDHSESADEKTIQRKMQWAIKKVTEDIQRLNYNTAIAAIMEYFNILYDFFAKYKTLDTQYCKTLVLLLAPFAPHMTEELWQMIQSPVATQKSQVKKVNGQQLTTDDNFRSIHRQPWPTFDPAFLQEDVVTVAVQVNGKMRGTISIPSEDMQNKENVIEKAKLEENISKHLEGKTAKTIIYVPGRILNFVI